MKKAIINFIIVIFMAVVTAIAYFGGKKAGYEEATKNCLIMDNE